MADDTPKVRLTEPQRLWLSAICAKLRHGEPVSARALKVELRDRLPRSFNPAEIDNRLLRTEDQITLLGVGLVDPQNELVEKANQVLQAIHRLLKSRPETKEIRADYVSNETKIPKEEVAVTFQQLGQLGIFHSSGYNYGHGIDGLNAIRIDDLAFDGYWKFESINQILEHIVPEEPPRDAPSASEVEQIQRHNAAIDIFISHSSQDVKIVKALIAVLQTALNLTTQQIRCTSIEGYKLDIGADTNEQLRKEIYDATVFIGLITPTSLTSTYVLFELGARWGAKRTLLPVVAQADTSILKDPLKAQNAGCLYKEADVHELIRVVACQLNRQTDKVAAYGEYIKLLTRLSKPKKESKVKSQDIINHEPNIEVKSGPPSGKKKLDPITQLDRKLTFQSEHSRFHNSEEGKLLARVEVEKLGARLEANALEANTRSPRIQFSFEHDGKNLWGLTCLGVSLSVVWHPGTYTNNLKDSSLYIGLWGRGGAHGNVITSGKELRNSRYEPDLDSEKGVVWLETGRPYQSEQLADMWFQALVDEIMK